MLSREERELAERVKQARLELRLSQRQFAKLVGVAQSTVSRWETGVDPPIWSASALSRATGHPPEWFGKPAQPPKRPRVPMFHGAAPDNLSPAKLDRYFRTRPKRGQ